MLKGLLWLLILLVAWGLFRSRSRLAREGTPPPRTDAGGAMVACAHCRVYLPEGEALRQDGNTFCSTAHYEAWKHRP